MTRRMGVGGAWIGLGLLVAPVAQAQSIVVAVDPEASQGLDTSAIESGMASAIGDELQIGDAAYLDSVADAAAIATRGMGVDYASNPKSFVIGGAVGFGAASQGVQLSAGDGALPAAGFAAGMSLMAGVNLGAFDGGKEGALDRVKLYANGMSYRPGGDAAFEARLLSVGGHVQIDLVKPGDLAKVIEWGGLSLTTGADYASFRMTLSQGLPIDADPARWDATGTYDIAASVTSIPIELSTNLRLAIVTAYLGGGFDVMPGTAQSTVSLAGPLLATVDGTEVEIGSVTVTDSASGTSSGTTPRVFVGGQLNLAMVKVFTHLNLGLNQSASLQFGGRIAI